MASVLVVEDNADLRDMYQEILVSSGHHVRAAEGADDAIAALVEAPADVIVLDLGIAGGIDRLRGAAGPDTRLILASGARDLPERAASLGARAYLLKPFEPERLLAAVEGALVAR
jgi:DNA-binding response OmpR family regulator